MSEEYLKLDRDYKTAMEVVKEMREENKKQKELIDKIKEKLKDNISVHEDEIWELIKEYEDENNNI